MEGKKKKKEQEMAMFVLYFCPHDLVMNLIIL